MSVKWMAAAVLLTAGVVALADSHVRIVRISYLAHGVEVSQSAAAGSRWTTALLNSPVVEAEQIRTERQGEAEVQLECGSTVRLTPEAEVAFPQLVLRDSGIRATTVALQHGTTYLTLRRADSTEFRALLPGGVITTQGAASLRVAIPDSGLVKVELLGGHATVEAQQRAIVLRKALALEFEPSGGTTWTAAATPDRWQQWSHERDEAFDRALVAGQPKPDTNVTSAAPPSATSAPAAGRLPTDAGDLFAQLDLSQHIDDQPFAAAAQAIRKVPHCADN